MYINYDFTKTGSGQTQGKLKKGPLSDLRRPEARHGVLSAELHVYKRQRRGLERATPAPTRYITKNKTVLFKSI
jgi:hypothetical protein